MKWATTIDLESCIGCQACALACKVEFNLGPGPARITVRAIEEGTFPNTIRHFQVNRCAQCADAPCVSICPTGALRRRSDGIVVLEQSACLGCSACAAACPYDAVSMNPDTGVADRCDLCVHRLDQGLEPACVVACPTRAIQVGDLDAPDHPVSQAIASGGLSVRRPELRLTPALHYSGARPTSLFPHLAARPAGGILQSTEQLEQGPTLAEASARIVAGDARAIPPWGPRTALLFWTRDIAAGMAFVPALGVIIGALAPDDALWRLLSPLLILLYLAGAATLAGAQVSHPKRLMLLTRRANLRSPVARAGLEMGALAAVMLLQGFSTLIGFPLDQILLLPALALGLALPVEGVLTLSQCRGRTLWRSPLSLPRAFFAASLAGSAMLLPFAGVLSHGLAEGLAAALSVATVGWLPLAVGEGLRPMGSPDARVAAGELRKGSLRGFYLAGLILTATGLVAPALGALVTPLTLAGLLLFQHAWLQAGQAAPQG